MSEKSKELGAKILELTPTERIEVVNDILASLDEPDEAVDRLWAKEAEDRLRAYRRGEIKAVNLEEVLASYRPR